jgi:hypothetical protein
MVALKSAGGRGKIVLSKGHVDPIDPLAYTDFKNIGIPGGGHVSIIYAQVTLVLKDLPL